MIAQALQQALRRRRQIEQLCRKLDPREAGKRLPRHVGGEIQVLGFHQGATEVAAVAFEAVLNLGPVLRQGFVKRSGHQDLSVVGKIRGESGRLGVKQRQVGFDAARHDPLADFAVDAAAGRIAGEVLAIAAPKALDPFAIGWELAGGQQVDGVHLVEAALGLRVEGADRFDLFVEQIDAIGLAGPHREQVDERAPHRKLSLSLDFRYCGIACGDQAFPEGGQGQPVAALEVEAPSSQPRQGREPLQPAVGRHQQQGRGPVKQGGQGRQALRQHLLMWRERVVGEDLGIGQVNQGQALRQKEAQLPLEPIGLLFVGGDQHGHAGVGKGVVGGSESGQQDGHRQRVTRAGRHCKGFYRATVGRTR